MGSLAYLRNVVTLKFYEEKCVGCGMCLLVCPQAVFIPNNGRVQVSDRDACMECGACARNCPAQAISVRSGVGCATAVINSMLGRKSSSCCCSISPEDEGGDPFTCSTGTKGSTCC